MRFPKLRSIQVGLTGATSDYAPSSATIKTAAAQEVQASPSKTPMVTPDDILTSPSEKPPPSSKPAQDESAPPSTSDVPF